MKSVLGIADDPKVQEAQLMSLEKQAEAYNSFVVMSALTFGFAVNVMFSDFARTAFEERFVLKIVAGILMDLALVCSAFTMIVMSLTDYICRRYMAQGKLRMANKYLVLYEGVRSRARNAFYTGLISFLIAVIIYSVADSTLSRQIVDIVILGIGTLFIAATTFAMMNPTLFMRLLPGDDAKQEDAKEDDFDSFSRGSEIAFPDYSE